MSQTAGVFDQPERLLGSLELASQLEKQEQQHRAHLRALLLWFVEVMDSFDRYFAVLDRQPELAEAPRPETVRLIARQLGEALGRAGVTPIPCLGQPAEPGRHEVMGTRDLPGAAGDEIVEELWRGYEWDGETLRKPRVIVARGAAQARKEE